MVTPNFFNVTVSACLFDVKNFTKSINFPRSTYKNTRTGYFIHIYHGDLNILSIKDISPNDHFMLWTFALKIVIED